MNFSQKLGLSILILISAVYVYFSFFHKGFKFPDYDNSKFDHATYNPLNDNVVDEKKDTTDKSVKKVKIFVLDKNGKIRSVNRECNSAVENSCFEYAVKELIKAPSKWEKSKGFTSEIPVNTKLLSLRESSESVMIDLSSDFEAGGGAESTYMRIKQIIKTANANTSTPTYLFINGRQANVIGGEGVMIKQPLNERSLDE